MPEDFDAIPTLFEAHMKDDRFGPLLVKTNKYKKPLVNDCFLMLAHYSNEIFPKFKAELTDHMQSIGLKVECGLKY